MLRDKISKQELQERIKDVKLLVSDFDGTLTSGLSFINNKGIVTREYSTNDHMGLNMIIHAGVKVALVTTGWEKAILHWTKTLKLEQVIMKCLDKGLAVEKLCKDLGISLQEVMYVGDDVNDISAMIKVGFPVTVANCHEEVKPFCLYISEFSGGKGGVRDICDIIMRAKTGRSFGGPYVPQSVLDII